MLLFFFLSRGLYMYCSHGNKLMGTTTASAPQLSFYMVTFQKYQVSALRRLKIGFYWVLTKKIIRQEIPVERSDGIISRLTYVFKMKTLFSMWIIPKAKDLSNTQQDAPRIQKRFQTHGRVGVSDTYIWHILRNNSIGK